MKKLLPYLLIVSSSMSFAHSGFVNLAEVCPGVRVKMNYASTDNFTGEVVPGYKSAKALFTRTPAEKLCQVQKDAEKIGLSLLIFDSYRPVKAVSFFMEWATRPENNPHLKDTYYPQYTRQEILDLGFIAKRSSHSKGSAIDLTLVDMQTEAELDMGTPFDFFDEHSHTESSRVTKLQLRNRLLLREMMEKHGFRNFSKEWWHYSYRPEPYPDQYFDFDIE